MKKLILFVLSMYLLPIQAQVVYNKTGIATFYDDKFDGRPTASGEIFRQNQLTAAHRSLPFGTMVKVTNVENKKSVVVKINDRGPFVDSRLIDLSRTAAQQLDFIQQGLAKVSVETIGQSGGTQTSTSQKQESIVKDSKVIFPNELYEIDIKYAQAKGFVVQVGSFNELSNLMRMAQEVQRLKGVNLLVQVTDKNNKKIHRLLVGPYSDRKSAELVQQVLKKSYPDCFVIEIN